MPVSCDLQSVGRKVVDSYPLGTSDNLEVFTTSINLVCEISEPNLQMGLKIVTLLTSLSFELDNIALLALQFAHGFVQSPVESRLARLWLIE